jgi:hypothetical protein
MEPTRQRKRLWIVVPWLIATLAVAGVGILLLVENHPPGRRSNGTERQDNGGGPLDAALNGTQRQDNGGGSPDAALTQCVAELQKSPGDQALREKIVKLAAQANPAPEIPQEARERYAQARKLFEAAETINDVGKAVDQYQAALLVAPWWPQANKDLGLALETAQRHDEALAALGLYLLAAGPGGHDAGAIEDEIHKIEAKRNKAFSMPLGIATRCQFNVPNLVPDYWLYLDGRLVSAPPHSGISAKYNLVELGPTQGYEFWDKEGVAARVKVNGEIYSVRQGADVRSAEIFDVEPGAHHLEFLLLNKEGFPFAINSADLELKTGDSRGFWFNMPANYVCGLRPAAIAPFFAAQGTDWQEEFSNRQAIVKKKIKRFADDPLVQALDEALLNVRLSPSDHPLVWVKLPSKNGGKRELDARLVAALVQYLTGQYGIEEDLAAAPEGSPADLKDALARLLPLIRAHNRRIKTFEELSDRNLDRTQEP